MRTGRGALDGHWIAAVALTFPLLKNLAAVGLVLAAPRWYLHHRQQVHAAFLAIFLLGLAAEDLADRESGQVGFHWHVYTYLPEWQLWVHCHLFAIDMPQEMTTECFGFPFVQEAKSFRAELMLKGITLLLQQVRHQAAHIMKPLTPFAARTSHLYKALA